jgi:hypothetical protein
MRLGPGRVKGMVRQAMKAESCIPCHETLSGDGAVCRGFFDRYKTQPLQIAERLNFIKFVAPPEAGVGVGKGVTIVSETGGVVAGKS